MSEAVRREPTPADGTGPDPAARRRWAFRLTGAAAAVLLVATVVLGVLLIREHQVADGTRALDSVLGADDARVISYGTSAGGSATVVVSHDLGRALVLIASIQPPPEGRIYQAWLLDIDNKATSAGLVEGSLVDVPALGDSTDAITLTEEPAGGSPQPTTEPIVRIEV